MVVGAGIVGASIAYHLARRGSDVTVLEALQPGSGASSHSFAWINATSKSPASYHDFNRKSMEMWGRFAEQLEADVCLRWGGQLRWESSPGPAQGLRELVRQLQTWGYPTRLIDEAELRELEPSVVPGQVAAAAYSEMDGQVEPQMVVDACLLRATEMGARVVPGTKATSFSMTPEGDGNRRVEAVLTERSTEPCDVVVLAAGTATTDLAAEAGIAIPQQISPGVVIRTTPVERLLRTAVVVYTPNLSQDRPEIHLRQCIDGSVIIGEGTQENMAQDDSQDHADKLLATASRYFPGLGNTVAVPVPVGYRPMPLDGYPVLGFSQEATNAYIALTHSGITLAPLVGELAAQEIVDGVRAEILKPYRPDRFA